MSTQGVPAAIVSQILGDKWPTRPDIARIQQRLFEETGLEEDAGKLAQTIRLIRIRRALIEAMSQPTEELQTVDFLTEKITMRLGEPTAMASVEKCLRRLEKQQRIRSRQTRVDRTTYTTWERRKPPAKPKQADPTS